MRFSGIHSDRHSVSLAVRVNVHRAAGEREMALLRIAHVPPPIVEPSVSVLEAVEVMARDRVGAVTVVENGSLRGIFSERDLMLRVVRQRRDPTTTHVREVMTVEVMTVTESVTSEE